MSLTRSTCCASVAATVLLLAGCSGSVSVGTGSIDADELADTVSRQLTETVGQEPDAVECPEDLDAEVDATTRCTLTAGDVQFGVTVTVTAVDGSDATFDIKVDDEPLEQKP